MGTHVTGLVLAAGQSRRMGAANKLLQDWQGKPLLRHVVDAARSSDLSSLCVVTGHQHRKIADLVGHDGECIHNPNFSDGMAISLVAGIATIEESHPSTQGVMVLLGDMPLVTAQHINQIIRAFEGAALDKIVVATGEGQKGNPVLFPARYFKELGQLSGDRGAKAIITAGGDDVRFVEIGHAALRDFDTPTAFQTED